MAEYESVDGGIFAARLGPILEKKSLKWLAIAIPPVMTDELLIRDSGNKLIGLFFNIFEISFQVSFELPCKE